MWSSLGAKLGILTMAALAIGLGACGSSDDDGTSPASLNSRLLPASQIPGFKIERKFEWDNPIDLVAQGLNVPQATPPSEAVKTFEDAGFEAGAGEQFVAAKGKPYEGPHGAVEVVQLGSDDDASEALDYVRKEALKQPCFAACSVDANEFAVAGIPGAKGVHLTPQKEPPPDAPPPFEAYAIAFTIGPRLYLVNADGGPGQIKKSQVISAAKALYDRNVKSEAA
jgi:hypothetical protein